MSIGKLVLDCEANSVGLDICDNDLLGSTSLTHRCTEKADSTCTEDQYRASRSQACTPRGMYGDSKWFQNCAHL